MINESNTNAGAYEVTKLRRKYQSKTRAIATAVAVSLLGAWFWGEAKEQYQTQRRRLIQRIISEELKAVPDDAGLNEKQCKLRLSQQRAREDDLVGRIVAIAQAVDIEH